VKLEGLQMARRLLLLRSLRQQQTGMLGKLHLVHPETSNLKRKTVGLKGRGPQVRMYLGLQLLQQKRWRGWLKKVICCSSVVRLPGVKKRQMRIL
jgi:hypothetical protein